MTDFQMSKEQRFGLHAVLVAASLSYLTGQTEWLSFLKNLGTSISALRAGWLHQDVALNEEPIYIAGRILQMREGLVDDLPESKWLDYQKMLDDVKYVALHEKVSGLFEMLGSDPSTARARTLEINIVPLDIDKAQTDWKG